MDRHRHRIGRPIRPPSRVQRQRFRMLGIHHHFSLPFLLNNYRHTSVSKRFFFEKKKQKTFVN
jgi:hypothetical protein